MAIRYRCRRARKRVMLALLLTGSALLLLTWMSLLPLPTAATLQRIGGLTSSSEKPMKKVIAMSLYGSDGRYTTNAVLNLALSRQNFPGWTLRFYTGLRPPSSKVNAVPDDVIAKLLAGGAEVTPVDARAAAEIPPMIWRFLVADDPGVDVFIVRDADSHLTRRDAAVVEDWLRNSTAAFHCVRDHPSHGKDPVSAGMWGARREEFARLMGNTTIRSLMKGLGTGHLQDMEFLEASVWPKVKDAAYCHDSVTCDRRAEAHPFPVKRNEFENVGQVFDAQGVGRKGDMILLKITPVNTKCIPP